LYGQFYDYGNDYLNIYNYLSLDKHLEFSEAEINSFLFYDQFDASVEVYHPFDSISGWDKVSSIQSSHIPKWWTAYNKLKHTNSPFAYFWNEFIKIPHERVKNGHLGSISPHMVTKIAEMVYTLRNRVRQSGENAPNFVSFLGSSGVRFPFSAQKNKRTGCTNEGLDTRATLVNAIAAVGAVFVLLHKVYGPGVVAGHLITPGNHPRRILSPTVSRMFQIV
jgi:hypothetical protein